MKRSKTQSLEQDLKELGRIVGRLRDLDVLGADIVGAIPVPPNLQSGFCSVTRAVATRRDAERDTMRQALAHPRMRALQLRLALLPTEFGWQQLRREKDAASQSIQLIARHALNKNWQRTLALGERIESLSIAERHDLRKRLKSLRYTLDAFSPLYLKKPTTRFVRDLKQLQKIFGYLNDATLAEQLYDIESATGRRPRHSSERLATSRVTMPRTVQRPGIRPSAPGVSWPRPGSRGHRASGDKYEPILLPSRESTSRRSAQPVARLRASASTHWTAAAWQPRLGEAKLCLGRGRADLPRSLRVPSRP